MPGFRPRKVPQSVIEKRLQAQFLDDLAHRVAYRLGGGPSKKSVQSLGPIEIKNIECAKGSPFRFTVRFWPMPEIELPDPSLLVVSEDYSDPRDQISHRLLVLVSFSVPDDLVWAAR